ncbi:MAG: histidine phosphatase family protein [Ruminiclostridium sp.]|nr:histidine phosphatase family protein [Ruminiclostridium sp.]
MLELILVRHGETDSNIRGAYCGWTDPDLNSKGMAQAQRVAEMLKGEKPDAIYSSCLKRAFNTSLIISKGLNPEILLDERLNEQNFGEWEDLTYCEISE